MRGFLPVLCLLFAFRCIGQGLSEEERFVAAIPISGTPPEGLLASRTVVLFSNNYLQKELEELQSGFQRIGIDAVSYVESERALAGKDLMNAYGRYFKSRGIRFLLFMKKTNDEYKLSFMTFNAKANWIDAGQQAWLVRSGNLQDLIQIIFRSLVSSQKRQNFLINDFPERCGPITTIANRREEDWAPGIRALKIAIPRFGQPDLDKELEAWVKENFKAKFEIVRSDMTEKEMLDKEFVFVLRYVHTRGNLSKEILGYDLTKSESALASESYTDGNLKLKTILSSESVFKFYIKNLEEDVYYLGRKWDADVTWQASLKNHVDGYRAAGKID